ncbi:NADH dehydrogenase (ubiquinone) B18 subunit [Lycorma delicatula]|uniref:NADH dehydrogenase (ubiquinone) B18 subunit n=1 Tax=Lycorma delicatula TaxID=130591 RepID=UPI003F512D6C
MGQAISHGIELEKYPEDTPAFHHEPKYDPLYGFPNGRKERVMIATKEEMESAKLPLDKRNYCAHLHIKYWACKRQYIPFHKRKCAHEHHEFAQCEFEDWVIRMKDFEREKRLAQRKRRLENHA